MADLYIRHSLNNKKTVKVLVSFRCFVAKSSGGDHIWTLELGTTSLDKDGKKINPVRIHNINVDSLDTLISENLSIIADQIDWSPLLTDKECPEVVSTIPIGDGVGLGSSVVIELKDVLPASGLDLSEMKILLDIGSTVFNITDECVVTGDPYRYKIKWDPRIRVNRTYN